MSQDEQFLGNEQHTTGGGAYIRGSVEITNGDLVGRDKNINVFYGKTRIPDPHQLPPPPRDFTGRELELNDLRASVQNGTTIIGIYGPGGVGKTTLALKLADELKPFYPDAQFFISLQGTSEQPLTAVAGMIHIIRAYGYTVLPSDTEVELRGLYYSVLYDKRAIILLDDACNATQIALLFPPANCLLIVTARIHLAVSDIRPFKLDMLPSSDAEKLLLTIEPRIRTQSNTIAQLCGYLPLALRAAATTLLFTATLEPSDYAKQLNDEQMRLEMDEGIPISLHASLNLSYQRLPPEAQRVFRGLAVFSKDYDAVAVEVICKDVGCKSLNLLIRHSLANYEDTNRRYHLHDLSQAFARTLLDKDEQYAIELEHAEFYTQIAESIERDYSQCYRDGEDTLNAVMTRFDLEKENVDVAWTHLIKWIDNPHHTLQSHGKNVLIRLAKATAYIGYFRYFPDERMQQFQAAIAAIGTPKDREQATLKVRFELALMNTMLMLGDHERAREQFNAIKSVSGIMPIFPGGINSLVSAHQYMERRQQIGNAFRQARKEKNLYRQAYLLAALGDLNSSFAPMRGMHPLFEIGPYQRALDIAISIRDVPLRISILCSMGVVYAGLNQKERAFQHISNALSDAQQLRNPWCEAVVSWCLGELMVRYGDKDKGKELMSKLLEIKKRYQLRDY